LRLLDAGLTKSIKHVSRHFYAGAERDAGDGNGSACRLIARRRLDVVIDVVTDVVIDVVTDVTRGCRSAASSPHLYENAKVMSFVDPGRQLDKQSKPCCYNTTVAHLKAPVDERGKRPPDISGLMHRRDQIPTDVFFFPEKSF
jgi:hypothetical protein